MATIREPGATGVGFRDTADFITGRALLRGTDVSLVWRPFPNATVCRVEVHSDEVPKGDVNRLGIESPPMRDTIWNPSAHAAGPMPPGRYSWWLTCRLNDGREVQSATMSFVIPAGR